MICLDHAEGGTVFAIIHGIEPTLAFFLERHIFGHKLEILDATFGNDWLDMDICGIFPPFYEKSYTVYICKKYNNKGGAI